MALRAIIVGQMSRAPSPKPDKRLKLDPAVIRAVTRARLNAEEHGEAFPETLSAAVEIALREWLAANHPEALAPQGRGRPRKTPVKKQ